MALDSAQRKSMQRPQFVDHFVITVLGQTATEKALKPIQTILERQGLASRNAAWLSGSPTQPSKFGYSCVEMHADGEIESENELRAAFLALADELKTDIVCQRESSFRRDRRMFVFDMDSTLIQGEVIDELAKMAGVGDQVISITASAMRGEIQFQESFRRRVGLLKGLPEARVYELLDRIPLMNGAERLFRTLNRLACKTAVLSGGFTFFGSSLQDRLGVDHVFANALDIADGLVTGQVKSQIVDGTRKAELLLELAAQEGIPLQQVVAVGDGANDLPMLKLAGMGVAFHAKPLVRATAQHSMTHVGLDGLLYLLGMNDAEIDGPEQT